MNFLPAACVISVSSKAVCDKRERWVYFLLHKNMNLSNWFSHAVIFDNSYILFILHENENEYFNMSRGILIKCL